jgi:perosamine synthetase
LSRGYGAELSAAAGTSGLVEGWRDFGVKRIPVAGPWITEKEIAYVTDAVTNAWYERAGLYHDKFEPAFASYVGARHAVSLPSCTSGIHLALAALGVGPQDEVVIPDCTWIASSAPISYVGATPVFADVERDTWCLSPKSFEQCLTPKTKAVIVVDLYGGVADYDAIRAIASKHGVAVIEDAAEAVGAEYKGKKAGSLGDLGVFSFHGSKTLTTGEGGMLVTDRKDLFDRVLQLRDHGRVPGDKMFWNHEVAFKYKMSSLQAALGLAQLERVEELVARKREAFGWYREELGNLDGVRLNFEPPGTRNVYWMVTAILSPELGFKTVQLMEALAASGIDSRPFFHPLSTLPAYESFPGSKVARERNGVSYAIAECGINLPSSLSLTRDDVRKVAEALRRALAKAPRRA